MMETSTRTDLQIALELFETCLETPLVPGELAAWSESLATACCQAKFQWQRSVEEEHPATLKQIRREDPEMASRVEKLQEEDAAISCQFDAVCHDVTAFHDRAPIMEEDEGRFEPVRAELVEAGLKLVIRIRTQEQALRTWFIEAFDRDRGNAD